jgi:xylan 1,4-beta-xylosidase
MHAAGLVLLALAMVAVTMLGPVEGSRAAASTSVLVSVDWARPMRARSAVGLLHGMDERDPPDRLIRRLAPRTWRADLDSAPYDRASAFGARYIFVLSDRWGYPGANWYGRRPPWEDFAAWTDFVRAQARANRGRRLVWDIWNEPDQPYFWNGTQAQFHQTYRIAYEAIRQELGQRATIAGPSVSAFRWSWLVGLLDYCREADCEVNALSWHELAGGRPALRSIPNHLRRARRALARNPAYVVLGLRELHVNEAVGLGDALYPGEQLAYLAFLERGGADAAARACWPDPSGTDNCLGHTLDGLLDSPSLRPRGAWWATAWYARGVASRVAASSTSPAVIALAAARSSTSGHAEILIGSFDPDANAPVAVHVGLRGLRSLPFLRRADRAAVASFRIASAGEEPVSPHALPARSLSLRHGAASLTIALRPHEVVLLRVSRAQRRSGQAAAR